MRKNLKIIRIYNCHECPYSKWNNSEDSDCLKMPITTIGAYEAKYRIYNKTEHPIPKWCPLENSE